MMRLVMTALLASALVWAPGCDTDGEQSDEAAAGEDQRAELTPEDIAEDQTKSGWTEGDEYFLVVSPDPNPIPFQELFELKIEVFEDEEQETPAEGVEIDQVRAVMPAHGHGMKNEPRVEEQGDGLFRAEGMRFHMQGEGEDGLWVLEIILHHGDTYDQIKFDVQCCRE